MTIGQDLDAALMMIARELDDTKQRLSAVEAENASLRGRVEALENGAPPPPPPDVPPPVWGKAERSQAFIRCAWARPGRPVNRVLGAPWAANEGRHESDMPGFDGYDWAHGANQGAPSVQGPPTPARWDSWATRLNNLWWTCSRWQDQTGEVDDCAIETRHPLVFRLGADGTWRVSRPRLNWSAQYPEAAFYFGDFRAGADHSRRIPDGARRQTNERGGQVVDLRQLRLTGRDAVHGWFPREQVGGDVRGMAFALQMRLVGPDATRARFLGALGSDLFSTASAPPGPSLGFGANVALGAERQWVCFVSGDLTVERLDANPPPLPAIGSAEDT